MEQFFQAMLDAARRQILQDLSVFAIPWATEVRQAFTYKTRIG